MTESKYREQDFLQQLIV